MNKAQHDSETPAHGQQKISAVAFIHAQMNGTTKVFMAKRALTKKFLPGVLELPGGHTDFGETLIDGLKREIREELNMEVRIGDPFAAFTYQNLIKGSHTVEVIYFAQFTSPLENLTIHPEDYEGYEWLSEAEILEREADITPQNGIEYEEEQDPEYRALLKGFQLLKGEALNFATTV